MLSNVSTATAVAERYFGSAEKSGSFVALLVDEGIGSGIMLGDKLFKGSCEIGHITVKFDGEKCECGNSGCLEKYDSIPNILSGTPYSSWSECVNADDREIMSREAEYLSSAIVTVNNIFDLDHAVLCGDISENSRAFTSLVESKTRERMILKKDFRVIGGAVKSAILVPCAMGVYDFLS
jgi:glucokinase